MIFYLYFFVEFFKGNFFLYFSKNFKIKFILKIEQKLIF
jgi:hypothetical protein